MPTTFTPGDQKQDEKLNPGQQDYDRRFGDLAKAEEKGTFDDIVNNYDKSADSSAPSTAEDYAAKREAAATPSASWANNVSGGQVKSNTNKFKGWLKKAGPLLGTGGVVGIGGFAMVALTSPSLLIVQMKEIYTEKFNTQLSSMQTRSSKLLIAKMDNSRTGYCSNGINIRCKYSSMSDKQVAKFKAAGIEVDPGGTTAILGRTKPATLKFQGETIEAKDFASRAARDVEFRSALKQAYNPKYAGFVGKAWNNVASRFKISKQPPELNAAESPEEARTKLNQLASEGIDDVGNTRLTGTEKTCDDSECTDLSEEEKNEINSRSEDLEAAKNGGAAADVRSKLSGLNSSTATSIFKATGALDSACQVYGAMNMLSYLGKAVRSAQLVRYAMIFFTVADTIKAGESPDPEDVALLGTILTTTIKDSSDPSKNLVGSATDSFGYKNAAYGDVTGPESSMKIASRFTSGSGFVGSMSGATAAVLAPLGGREKARGTCKVLANPAVQGVSLVLGVAMLFVPGVNVAKAGTSIAIAGVVGIALATLPSLLADTIAGTVTDDIVGQESGDAQASGGCALLCDALASQTGNAAMSKEDAIAYNSLQTEVKNQYIADELREASPFDPMNPHTFIGSMVKNLLPLQSSSNPLTVVSSLLSTSMSNIIPKSSAVSEADYAKSLDICQDLDVLEGEYAADPFCNIVRGIPPKYLNKDPLAVVNKLIEDKLIDESGTPNATLQSFIDKCMLSTKPPGYDNPESTFDKAEIDFCKINDENADYYLFYMDGMIDSGFDGDYGEAAAAVPDTDTEATLPSGNAAELAQLILSSGNVVDRTGQLGQIVGGSRTNVSPNILSVVAALSTSNKFTISSLKRDQALGVGAGNSSLHLQGSAVDISGSAGINGVSFGYNGIDPAILSFAMSAAAALPGGCQIGLPNQGYVNAIKPRAKPGCAVFVDKGSGAHIHLAVKGGV